MLMRGNRGVAEESSRRASGGRYNSGRSGGQISAVALGTLDRRRRDADVVARIATLARVAPGVSLPPTSRRGPAMDDVDFADLIARVRAHDQGAIADLLHRFEADVRTMVRVRLPRALRNQFDSMDFVQA